jgi:hypothetical protein
MVVPAEIGGDAMAVEQRLQVRDEGRMASIMAARPDGVMPDANLPVGLRRLEFVVQPCELRLSGIPDEIFGIENEEVGGDAVGRLRKAIIPAGETPAGASGRVGDLRVDVAEMIVIAEGGIPGDLKIGPRLDVLKDLLQQRVVRRGDAVRVEVVTGRNDKLGSTQPGERLHACGDLMLERRTRSPVANHQAANAWRGQDRGGIDRPIRNRLSDAGDAETVAESRTDTQSRKQRGS